MFGVGALRFYRRLIGKAVRIGFPDGGLGDLFAPGSQDHRGARRPGADRAEVTRITVDETRAASSSWTDAESTLDSRLLL